MREIRPGYWQLRVSLGRDPITQKSKYRTRGLRATKRDAGRALTQLVADVTDERADSAPESVGTLLEQWLAHIEHEGRSPTTMRGYRSLRNQLPAGFLRLPLKKLTTKTLDDLYRHLAEKPGRGPSSVKHIHAMLRAAFHQAMRWDLLDRNPAVLASPPRVPTTEVEPPPVADVLAVIDAARRSRRPENAVVFQVLAATGCRRSEACGLRWTDLDLGAGTVTICRAIVQIRRPDPPEDHQGPPTTHRPPRHQHPPGPQRSPRHDRTARPRLRDAPDGRRVRVLGRTRRLDRLATRPAESGLAALG
jgi:integrase